MKTLDIDKLIRSNISRLKPYSSARSEFTGEGAVFLDANENPNNTLYNRYPDPLQWNLKRKIAKMKGVEPGMIFLGNGSDEAIDLLIRAFCQPGKDKILSVDPTYGMYKVCADINEVEYNEVLLTNDFQPDIEQLMQEADSNTKLLFLCSPNNPTANDFSEEAIVEILNRFKNLVVLDEAYIDFSNRESFLTKLAEYQNLVILQTFSKAWGLAGIRLGMCFADKRVISVMNKIKYPYNVNSTTLRIAAEALENKNTHNGWVEEIIKERKRLVTALPEYSQIINVYPSDANFILVKVKSPELLYKHLVGEGIIVRDRSKVSLCDGCLRITVGRPEENDKLLKALAEFEKTL
ncbi:MAG: histidinol-phosphate transaminase [Bacteroidales bacterium]|nr:histidinol-phosphate transaminase [Bacteroidales bacterium]